MSLENSAFPCLRFRRAPSSLRSMKPPAARKVYSHCHRIAIAVADLKRSRLLSIDLVLASGF
jgi:hypothetical protein